MTDIKLPFLLSRKVRDAETGEDVKIPKSTWHSNIGVVQEDEINYEKIVEVDDDGVNDTDFDELPNNLYLEFMQNGPIIIKPKSIGSMTVSGNDECGEGSDGIWKFDEIGTFFNDEDELFQSQKSDKELYRMYFSYLWRLTSKLYGDPRWRAGGPAKGTQKPLEELKKSCKKIARVKTNHTRHLGGMFEEERELELARQAKESKLGVTKTHLNHVRKRHQRERKAFKTYIEETRHLNKIVLMRRMRKEGLLW